MLSIPCQSCNVLIDENNVDMIYLLQSKLTIYFKGRDTAIKLNVANPAQVQEIIDEQFRDRL